MLCDKALRTVIYTEFGKLHSYLRLQENERLVNVEHQLPW